MSDSIRVQVNGKSIVVPAAATVAVAVITSGESAFRRSVSGEPRGPLCGMGICFECRLTIDGVPHARSCQIVCREGMVVVTA
jgi:sarcosine oxidase subunit alpha